MAAPERTWLVPSRLRRVLILGPPLALALLEILHPLPELDAQSVMDVATWFAVFHVIQLALVGLVVLSVILLADDFGHAGAWSTRLGLGVFLVFFSAYDAVAGIATGLAMRSARDLSPIQQEGVFEVVKDWPGVSPVFGLSIVGTPGWLVAVGALALAARRQGAPRSEWILLALAAFFLMLGHPFPGGTLAFGCLFAAGMVHEFRSGRDTAAEPRGPAFDDG
ncbi:MAG TPA: hypothetical protein VF423_14155 [Actinomycetes bacterium]